MYTCKMDMCEYNNEYNDLKNIHIIKNEKRNKIM